MSVHLHDDFRILRPLRRRLAKRAFVRLILDGNKLDSEDQYLLANKLIVLLNEQNKDKYKYTVNVELQPEKIEDIIERHKKEKMQNKEEQ